MKEYIELKKVYDECIKYLKNVDSYNYDELCQWAQYNYADWISKNPEYVLGMSGETIPPRDNREKSFNMLNNLRLTLEKIAFVKGFNINSRN